MALRAELAGKIVDVESKPWQMNGREGVSHTVFLRTGSERDGAVRVRVDFSQLGLFKIGEDMVLPVDISAQASDFGGPRLSVRLDPDFSGKHAAKPAPKMPAPASF